jgi:DNA-binding transcriptional LysR family regulator
VELRDVETFLVLAEELHFGRTAARLHITQGRVSQTIQSLEREVGAALFERTSRRVRLTAIGEAFRPGAQKGFGELERTLREARQAARDITAELQVGYMASIGGELVTRMAAAFERRHPSCRLVLSALTTISPAALGFAVRPGIDLALVWSPGGRTPAPIPAGRTVGPVLGQAGRAVLVPDGHPLAARESIGVEDLADYVMLDPSKSWLPAYRDAWLPTITPTGRPIRFTAEDVCEMTGRKEMMIDDFLTLVARGRGLHCTVATLLDQFPFPGLSTVPIHDLPAMQVVPVWETATETATIHAFVEAARSVLIAAD